MRIREIVDEIERGDLDVDLLSDRVKEAMRLSRLCNDKLLKIDGDGPIGGITVTADSHARVKGYVQNPEVLIHANAKGKLDVGGAVGPRLCARRSGAPDSPPGCGTRGGPFPPGQRRTERATAPVPGRS